MSVEKKSFGHMPDGREISLYLLKNKAGVEASVTDLGAIWVGLLAPDKNGVMADVVLGYDSGEEYLVNGPHLGSIVGRIANRTGGAGFCLHGKNYVLEKNDGDNNLHSGTDYYDRRLWKAEELPEENGVRFFLESPDGDQGFPGNLKLSVTYELTEDSMLLLTYRAVSDQDTPLNLTNHGYFNLAGHEKGSVLSHEVQIEADFFTPSAADSIPTGEVRTVSGTPMDFRVFKEIGRDISVAFDQLQQAKGYDHNWCLRHEPGEFALAAMAREKESGRCLKVYTNRPGVQFYTANWLGGEKGKNGSVYEDRDAFCFETQDWPDAVNKPHFPSPVIKAGEEFVSRTGYQFTVSGDES